MSRQSRWGYLVEEINVDLERDLRDVYGECVPVVLINGKLRFRGRVEPGLLDRLLDAEERSVQQFSRRG